MKFKSVSFLSTPFLLGLLGFMSACSTTEPLPTVEQVDINQYKGEWFEIARLPQSFEKDCACVTAEYGLREDGNISVLNTCYDTVDSKWNSSEGKAFVQEGSNNTILKVQFFFPFKGDYYIIELDDDYQYAMVGSPNRNYLWILSRTPKMDDVILNKLKMQANELGFDLTELILTGQDCKTIERDD